MYIGYDTFVHSFNNGSHEIMYWALLFATLGDLVLGVAVGFYKQRLSSNIGTWGMIRKTIVIIIPLVIYPFFDLLGILDVFQIIVGSFLMFELISVVENLDILGVPVPDVVRKYLAERKEK